MTTRARFTSFENQVTTELHREKRQLGREEEVDDRCGVSLPEASGRAQMHEPSQAEQLAVEKRRNLLLRQCVREIERERRDEVSRLNAELARIRKRDVAVDNVGVSGGDISRRLRQF